MAALKAMESIKGVLLSTQGGTGEMLSEGLFHALQDRPEERHELQAALLKMVAQELSSARSAAKVEAEVSIKQKVDAAEAELEKRKAAVANATADLAAANATAASQKEKLDECRRQLTWEEEEHKRVQAADEDKAKEVAEFEQGRLEVIGYLEAVAQKGGETILKYLSSVKAEAPLQAALVSVLKKEPLDRAGFDEVALQHLRMFLEKKVSEWDETIEAMKAGKANIHAEALGAWAVKEVTGEHVREAAVELEGADAAVAAAEQKLNEVKEAEQEEENVLSHYLTDLTLAQDRVRQCGTALETLERLVMGQEMVVEAPSCSTAAAMEVDTDLVASKTDAVLDADMGVPIAA